MEIVFVTASRADTVALERLLQLYEFDFSECGGSTSTPTASSRRSTRALWQLGDQVFLIKVDGRLGGFAIVARHATYLDDGTSYPLREFSVLRKHRRRGIGEHVARVLFDRSPGNGDLGTARGNAAAQAFWRRVLGRYTGGRYREVAEGCGRWRGPIWAFPATIDQVRPDGDRRRVELSVAHRQHGRHLTRATSYASSPWMDAYSSRV
jgi:predicted acetyltransferase